MAVIRMNTSLSLVALLGLLGVACSSGDEGGSNEDGAEEGSGGASNLPNNMGGSAGEGVGGGAGSSGTLECDPNGDIPCIDGIAEPCRDLNSGFLGDEYCLVPPDAEVGMQIRVGPDDYHDPDSTGPYMIEPGGETSWAEVVQFPNTENVFTRGYRSHMRPGSHHFIMFGMDQGMGSGPIVNGSGTESAVGVGGRFLGGATRAVQNVDTRGEYPEDQGIGSEVPANTFVAMNLHFVNAEDVALLQEIWVNFIYIPGDEVTQYVKPITWYGGLAMDIPPGTHTVLANAPGTCTPPAPMPEEMRVGLMTAHAHANTLRVTTTMNGSTVLFEDYDWHEPTEWRFNRATTNPTPDPVAKISGGYTGLLPVSPTDDFVWECEVQNQQNVNLTFGNKVYTGEMCNVFGFYITKTRATLPWTCAFF